MCFPSPGEAGARCRFDLRWGDAYPFGLRCERATLSNTRHCDRRDAATPLHEGHPLTVPGIAGVQQLSIWRLGNNLAHAPIGRVHFADRTLPALTDDARAVRAPNAG